MKKKILASVLAAAVMLAGCGKIEGDPQNGKSSAQGAAQGASPENSEDYYENLLGSGFTLSAIRDNEILEPTPEASQAAARLILETLINTDTDAGQMEKELFPDGRETEDLKEQSFEITLDLGKEPGIFAGGRAYTGNIIRIRQSEDIYYFDIFFRADPSAAPEYSLSACRIEENYVTRILEALTYTAPDNGGYDRLLSCLDSVELYNGGAVDITGREQAVAEQVLSVIGRSGNVGQAVETDVYCMDIEYAKTGGFLTYVRFSEPVDIPVGDSVLGGDLITIILDGTELYFEIDTTDGNGQVLQTGSAICLSPDCINDILKAAGSDTEQGGQTSGVLTPDNIDNYQFGFELYSDGHKDCWESRYACAKVMLEAISHADPARTVDLVPTLEQLNDKETSGFMTWLKFEEDMNFRVGDTTMTGHTLNIIDYDESYYFWIGDFEEISCMIEFDSSYIPKLLEAAEGGGTQVTGGVFDETYTHLDLSTTNLIMQAAGRTFSNTMKDAEKIEDDQVSELIKGVLSSCLADLTPKPGAYIDSSIAENDHSAFYMLFDFGKPTQVKINGEIREIYVIEIGGKPGQDYLINVNNEDVYEFSSDVADHLKSMFV